MKKELNFEVNIMPVLDILSVMICFLLLTAVWSSVQSLDVKQAVGDNNSQSGVNPPSIWALLDKEGRVQLSLRDIPSSRKQLLLEKSIPGLGNKEINWTLLEQDILRFKQRIPELKAAMVMPKENSNYGDVIKVLDAFKKAELMEVGVVPL